MTVIKIELSNFMEGWQDYIRARKENQKPVSEEVKKAHDIFTNFISQKKGKAHGNVE